MKDTLRIAGVYVGTIIGAGYASGQEILQFFTGYGWWGILGTLVTMILYPLLGYYLVVLGKRVKAWSHKTLIYHICGKYLGAVVDILLAFFLFGVGVIMIAGSGSLFQQQFGIPPVAGYALMTVLVITALLLSLRRVLDVISILTPVAFLLVIALAIYAAVTADTSGVDLETVAATQQELASPHWLLSAALHVSFNVAITVSILALVGATEPNYKAAKRGAVLGGILLGIIALVINLALYMNVGELVGTDMPMLIIATDLHPYIGAAMALVLLAMIFNTAVPTLYSFTARFFTVETRSFRIAAVVVGIAAFGFGFVGFTTLVGTVYPLLGYVGFVIFISMGVNLIRTRRKPVEAEEFALTE
ncbi:MAG TPA: hypothetical protein K8V32_03670 [Enteractinococcus helveticum]|uniref:Membrane protein YkvI n=1 Tax=Enteractinococcus helveticum TaxID=1837282 RepID=A0A921FLL1_9MICC|nr:hypothetical protein [Enteractinococcus helveticum]HJF13889.1 hypothetical protein [Enteractinococcus helveticum]